MTNDSDVSRFCCAGNCRGQGHYQHWEIKSSETHLTTDGLRKAKRNALCIQTIQKNARIFGVFAFFFPSKQAHKQYNYNSDEGNEKIKKIKKKHVT